MPVSEGPMMRQREGENGEEMKSRSPHPGGGGAEEQPEREEEPEEKHDAAIITTTTTTGESTEGPDVHNSGLWDKKICPKCPLK